MLVIGTRMASFSFNKNNTPEITDSLLKFAQVSDVHLDTKGCDKGKRLYSSSKDLFIDAINQINNIKDLEFVIFTGDMINRANEADLNEFIKLANKINIPWYIALGNHDIAVRGKLNKERYIDAIKRGNINFKADLPYYSFSPKEGYLFIALDGVIDSRITANGYIDNRQLDWLDNTLKNNKNSKVIIFQHFPVVEPSTSKSHMLINAKKYQEILNKYSNVLMILSGHYHQTKIIKNNGIIHVSTPALVEYPNAFRIISIREKTDRIKIGFKTIETGLKYLQEKSKSRSKSPEVAYGDEKDRTRVINIFKKDYSSDNNYKMPIKQQF